jgi:hypothetical protein
MDPPLRKSRLLDTQKIIIIRKATFDFVGDKILSIPLFIIIADLFIILGNKPSKVYMGTIRKIAKVLARR